MRPFSNRVLLLFATLCLFIGVASADEFETQILKGKAFLQKGINTGDEATLMSARSLFERLLQNEEMQWLTNYYIAFTDSRLASVYQLSGRSEEYLQRLDTGIEYAKKSVALDATFADAQALLSSLLGRKITSDPSLGPTLGMASQTALQTAMANGKDNPRVAMTSALALFYTPVEYGGDKAKARIEMARAVELFAKENLKDKKLPDHGHDEALIWMGRFAMDAKEFEEAQKHLKAALKQNPESGFAKFSMQELEQQMAQKQE